MKSKCFKWLLSIFTAVFASSLFSACETILDVNNRFTYTLLEDGTYEVSLNTKVSGLDIAEDFILENVTKIVIPDEYKGIPVTSIGERAFQYCENLKSVIISEFVTSIGAQAFYGCEDLARVVIPESVISIGEQAFYGCNSLASVTIPNSVMTIGARAFYSCRALENIIIGDSVTSIGGEAFMNTAYYNEKDNWQDGVLYVGNHLIVAKITLSGICSVQEGTLSIADCAFSNCVNLTSILLPDSVVSIGESALRCKSLTSIEVSENNVNYKDVDGNLYSKDGGVLVQYALGKRDTSFSIPDFVRTVGGHAFVGCDYLTNITIGDGVTSIEEYAFCGCIRLTGIEIGSSVTDIADYAFAYCLNLENVEIPDSVTSLGEFVFSGCTSLANVKLGKSLERLGEWTFSLCEKLTSIQVDEENTAYEGIDGNLYTKGGVSLVQYAIGKTQTSFAIPDSVTTIENSAFYNCKSLTSVVIPNSVKTIGDCAFWHCSGLTSVEMGQSVVTIGSQAFAECSSLANVNISNSVTSIGNHAFYTCESLKSVTIPSSVTSIGRYAFDGCYSLKSVAFENPNGWRYSTWERAKSGPSFSSADLADSAKASQYLRVSYRKYYWQKD